jgi:hypothetical protein
MNGAIKRLNKLVIPNFIRSQEKSYEFKTLLGNRVKTRAGKADPRIRSRTVSSATGLSWFNIA